MGCPVPISQLCLVNTDVPAVVGTSPLGTQLHQSVWGYTFDQNNSCFFAQNLQVSYLQMLDILLSFGRRTYKSWVDILWGVHLHGVNGGHILWQMYKTHCNHQFSIQIWNLLICIWITYKHARWGFSTGKDELMQSLMERDTVIFLIEWQRIK